MDKKRLEEIQELKAELAKELKNKKFTTLNGKQKDKLIETMAKILGLID